MGPKIPVLSRLFLHNKGAKIASVCVACVVWYIIQSIINYETVVPDVPLTIEVEPGWAILDRSPDTVDVLFRGSQDDIRKLSRDQVSVDVDVRGQPFQSTSTVRLDARNIKAPGAVRAVAVRPDEVTLRLDQEGEKQVAVKADLQGGPPEGYEVESVICTPASVVLYGPRQRLDEVETVRTLPIDLEGRTRSFRKLKMGIAQPGEAWAARIAPSNVTVEVTIVERSAAKDLDEVPVRVLLPSGPRARVDVFPDKVKVVLKGRAELLKNLQAADVQAYADCAGLQAGASYDLPVRVQVPQGLAAQAVEPSTVKVTMGEP